MKNKRLCAFSLSAALMLGLTACSGNKADVPVQQVGMLTGAAEASDKYAGLVVSENTTEIQRDENKTIKELFVAEGDTVKAGQKLFSYDVEQLQLELDRQQLELERLNNEITSCNSRLKSLEAQLKKATDTTEKTNLNLQISSETANKNEANYNRNVKQKEITQTKNMLSNVSVTSPVNGRVRKINEESYGAGSAYITIQDTGSYRVKGTLNELSMAGGIAEGVAVNIISRMDPNVMWTGVVSMIDYEGGSQNNSNNGMMGGAMEDSTGSTTSYPFYIELDSSEGLLLGQHVYIEVAGSGRNAGLWVPSSYLFDIGEDPETAELTAGIWVANEDNELEMRLVTLGEYDAFDDTYEVLDGLSIVDYVADPELDNCTTGATVSYRNVTDFEKPAETEPPMDDLGGEFEPDNGGEFADEGFVDDGFAVDGDFNPEIVEIPTDAVIVEE